MLLQPNSPFIHGIKFSHCVLVQYLCNSLDSASIQTNPEEEFKTWIGFRSDKSKRLLPAQPRTGDLCPRPAGYTEFWFCRVGFYIYVITTSGWLPGIKWVPCLGSSNGESHSFFFAPVRAVSADFAVLPVVGLIRFGGTVT